MSIRWVSGIQFRIYNEIVGHDDRILETPTFLTFSDASTDDVKIAFAAMAEESLYEIVGAFQVSSVAELGIVQTDPSTKITIYTNKSLSHPQLAFDLDPRSLDGHLVHRRHRRAHQRRSQRPHRYPGGSQRLVGHPDHYNPIAIRAWTDLPDSVEARGGGEYYPMFGLAVRYLMDDRGHGKTYLDVKDMYLDLITAGSVARSFERYMGMSTQEYENAFFDFMTAFLPSQAGHVGRELGTWTHLHLLRHLRGQRGLEPPTSRVSNPHHPARISANRKENQRKRGIGIHGTTTKAGDRPRSLHTLECPFRAARTAPVASRHARSRASQR